MTTSTSTAAQGSAQNGDPIKSLLDMLPDLPSTTTSIVDRITSILGKRNPFAHEIDAKETVLWLFDNTSYTLHYHRHQHTEQIAAYFQRQSGTDESKIVATLAEAIGVAENDEARKTIASRLVPFLYQILPARTAHISFGDEPKSFKIGPSDGSGISKDVLTLPSTNWKDGAVVPVKAIGGVEKQVTGVTTIAAQEGFAVISDIDDTIKVTMTNNPLGILQTTFVNEPEPIKGMPEFYKEMNSALGGPPFWYLSASPYNLYPFLRAFREEHYPAGTMLLRNASWRNMAGFLTSLSQNTKDYKVDNMKKVHKYWPKRKFVCIGDSTQSDPEAYGEMYRANPTWIKAIWIRKVEDVKDIGHIFPGQSQEERNKPERFEAAFKDVPKSVWHVFEDPEELKPKLAAVVAAS